jgi:shikimate kinase
MNSSNVSIIGPRCVGKTNTGICLAELLGRNFVDADGLLETREGRTIKEITKKEGWEYFRELESKTLVHIMNHFQSEKIVLAPGGGAVAHEYAHYREENLRRLRKFGDIVLLLPTENLEENAEIITQRMSRDDRTKSQRPRFTDLPLYQDVLKMLRDRDAFYRQASDRTFYTMTKNEREIAELIKKELSLV